MRTIYFDGSPKLSGLYSIYDTEEEKKKKNIIIGTGELYMIMPDDFQYTFPSHSTKITCNVAEYFACYLALLNVKSYERCLLIGDSQRVVNQMMNKEQTKVLKRFKNFGDYMIKRYGLNVTFEHRYRDDNIAGVYLEDYIKSNKKNW